MNEARGWELHFNAEEWSALEVRNVDDGPRHFLEGRALRTGMRIVLQGLEVRGNGLYRAASGAVVKYEGFFRDPETVAPGRLCLFAGGWEFRRWLDSSMRFRWPVLQGQWFTCPRCMRTSHSQYDNQEGYCGACNDWTAGG